MLRVVRPSNVNVKLPPDASHSTSCVSRRDVPPDGEAASGTSSFEASAFDAFTGGVAGADVGEPFRFADPGIFAHLGPEASRDRRELEREVVPVSIMLAGCWSKAVELFTSAL